MQYLFNIYYAGSIAYQIYQIIFAIETNRVSCLVFVSQLSEELSLNILSRSQRIHSSR